MNFNEQFCHKIKGNPILRSSVPKEYEVEGIKNKAETIKYDSVDIFYDFLVSERDFWAKYSTNSFFSKFKNNYDSAINQFSNANNNVNNYEYSRYLNQVINSIIKIPNSNTVLSKQLIKYENNSEDFLNGYLAGINKNSIQTSATTDYIKGIFSALEYIGLIKKLDDLLEEEKICVKETIESLSNQSNDYVSKYNDLFKSKNEEFNTLDKKINDTIELNKINYDNFVKEKDVKITELEKLYNEKLRMSKPADYWLKMFQGYKKSGIIWLIISMIIAIITIILLVIIIIKAPIMSNEEHWFDTLKNTALLTVITSISVYVLRLTVKIAMSSLHLSRDAKEREQLTYFYLSLMHEKAVTEKERELILVSLFSRSDTGLLKGDSSPEMPNINISDYISKK